LWQLVLNIYSAFLAVLDKNWIAVFCNFTGVLNTKENLIN
jgi:hypothetical protein